jgi:hypothetical protein
MMLSTTPLKLAKPANHANPANPVRFSATFEVDQSFVTRLQQWYGENGFSPANTPQVTDASHPFQSIYVAGIKNAMLKFKPLLDAIPDHFKLTFTPSPPFNIPGKDAQESGGTDHFDWTYNALHPNATYSKLEPVQTSTGAAHRYWTPLGHPKRSECTTPTITLTNPQTWLDALNQFKQWLPLGILAIATKAQTLNQENMNKVTAFQQKQQDNLAWMIASFAGESAVYYPANNIPDITQGLGTVTPSRET